MHQMVTNICLVQTGRQVTRSYPKQPNHPRRIAFPSHTPPRVMTLATHCHWIVSPWPQLDLTSRANQNPAVSACRLHRSSVQPLLPRMDNPVAKYPVEKPKMLMRPTCPTPNKAFPVAPLRDIGAPHKLTPRPSYPSLPSQPEEILGPIGPIPPPLPSL